MTPGRSVDDASFAALVDSIEDAIVGCALDDTITHWNKGAERLLGRTADEVVGACRLAEVLPDDATAAVERAVEAVVGGDRAQHVTTIQIEQDGRRRHLAVTIAPVHDATDAVVALSVVVRDITTLMTAVDRERRAAASIEAQQRVLQRIASDDDLAHTLDDLCRDVEQRLPGAHCTVLTVDPQEEVLRHASAPSLPPSYAAAIDRLPIEEGMGVCGTAAHRQSVVVIRDVLRDPLTASFVELARAHDLRSAWSHPLVARTGEVLGTFAVYRSEPYEPDDEERRSVTAAGRLAALAIERRSDRQALSVAALVDPLTGLPNRVQFMDWLERALCSRPESVAVMFLDLDQFKGVNDSMGHPAGDRMLVEVARRLTAALRSDDVLSRFGGDEFTVLVRDADRRDLAAVAEELLATFAEPFVVDGREFFMSGSIGIAHGAEDVDPFDLIRDADVAMYDAKARGPGRHTMFGAALRERALARVAVESELRRGLERGELVVEYQPVFDLCTRECLGAEALARWQHPDRGLLPPSEFIPVAEESGLVVMLGARVLNEVLAQIRRWADQGLHLPVSVNVSPVQLADAHFVSEVRQALVRHGVDAGLLYLEITESALMEDLDAAREALGALASIGVGVLIDDFGTGYSSIGRLSDLPVTGLKIDRRFTIALGSNQSMTKVTIAIIDLALALDLAVVAEGIEDESALEALVGLDCGVGQGFHLARPGPPELVAALATSYQELNGSRTGPGSLPRRW